MIEFKGDYTQMTMDDIKKFDEIFSKYRTGIDSYNIFHNDISYLDINLIKTIINYAIQFNQSINITLQHGEITSMEINICSDCLACAYAEYLGYTFELTPKH